MPRHGKKYFVPPHNATAASNESNATTAAPTVSHSTQSDDEGNVIVELEIQSHAGENNSGSGVHEIPEEVELETNTNNTNDPRSDEHLADIALLSTPELHESDATAGAGAAAAAEAASAPDSASIPPNDATPPHATAPTPTPTTTSTSTVAEDVNVDSAPRNPDFFVPYVDVLRACAV